MEDIKIGGKLHSVATEHVVASASEIYDDSKSKNQATINIETDAAFAQIDNEIEALEKQDVIPVDELPSVSDANPKAVYRIVGESSYTDYMVNATGDGWKELAVLSFPGIDNVPTLNSDNLVKSGGVAGVTDKLTNTNYMLAGCKENVYDKSYVRVGKGIRNLGSGTNEDGTVVNESTACITGYYKIPDEADILHISGGLNDGSALKIRFVSEPNDSIVNGEYEENVFVVAYTGTQDFNLVSFRQAHPRLKYFCAYVYRDNQTTALNNFSIIFENIESEVNGLKRAMTGEIATIWNYGFINKSVEGHDDGEEVSSQYYRVSDFIPVSKGEAYTAEGVGNGNIYRVAFYDNLKVFQGGIVAYSVAAYLKSEFVVPDGISFVRISGNASSNYGLWSKANLQKNLEYLQSGLISQVETVWNYGYITAVDIKGPDPEDPEGEEIIIHAANTIVETVSGNYQYSDTIEVDNKNTYIVGISGSKNVVGVMFYDEEDSPMVDYRILNNNKYQTLFITIPDGAKTMRLTKNTSFINNYNVYICNNVLKSVQQGGDGKEKSTPVNGTYWLKERMKYGFLDNTKKPCIVFEMDINQVSDRSDNTQAFVDKLKEIGAAPTFLIMPKRFRLDVVVQKMQNYMSQGVEIAIHTEPEDGIGSKNPEPHPTIAQFKTIMEDEVTRDVGGTTVTYPGYIPTFLANGFYPLGLVVSNSQTYIPEGGGYPYGDYLIYAHTLFGGRHGDNVSNFINTQATDRMEIKRWQIEESDAQTEEQILQDFKNAVDYIKQNNGIFVVYCHTYNETGQSYTLPQSLLESMVEHIKSDVLEQKIVVGTMADVVKYYYDR